MPYLHVQDIWSNIWLKLLILTKCSQHNIKTQQNLLRSLVPMLGFVWIWSRLLSYCFLIQSVYDVLDWQTRNESGQEWSSVCCCFGSRLQVFRFVMVLANRLTRRNQNLDPVFIKPHTYIYIYIYFVIWFHIVTRCSRLRYVLLYTLYSCFVLLIQAVFSFFCLCWVRFYVRPFFGAFIFKMLQIHLHYI